MLYLLKILPRHFLPCLLAACVSVQAAEKLPPAPADGIWDDTRALPAEARQGLGAGIAALRERQGIALWLVAETYLPHGQAPRERARLLRQAWSPQGASVLLLYDRSSGREAVSFSPDLWSRLPASGLFQLHHRLHEGLLAKSVPLEQKLPQATQRLLAGLSALGNQQAAAGAVLTRDFYRLARAYALALGVGVFAAFFAGGLSRRRQQQARPLAALPRTHVPPRFGGPHGSQIIASRQAQVQG